MVSKQESRIYYIEKGRLIFVENDLDNPNRIAVSVSSGTTIQVYDESLIGFMSDGKFYSWTLKGFSTKLAKNDAYYIYARLDRTGVDALVVFSINQYNLDGSRANAPEGEENPPSEQYYYVRIGEVTATDGTTNREVTYDSGVLGTTKDVYENAGSAQLNEMFQLNKTSDPWYIIVKHYFYDLTIKRSLKLLGTLIWGDKELQGIHTSEDAAADAAPDDQHLATSAYTQQFGDKRYLRKDQADRTEHSLGVGGSLSVGGDQTVNGNHTVEGSSLIKGLLSLLTGAASTDFLSGFLGAGFELRKDEATGRWRLEVDELMVRVVATFFELVIHKLRHVGGSIVLTPASMQCVRVEEMEKAYRCYFKQTDGERSVVQEFVVGDQALSQSFNLQALDGGGVRTSFYWRLVTAVGEDWIDLSKTDCAEGSGVPQAGDDIVQLGNRSDVTRQNAIILDTTGSDAPSIKQYRGINGYTLSDDMAITVFSSKLNRIRGQFISEATGEDYDQTMAAMGETVKAVRADMDAVKEQTDREFTIWFYDVDPTAQNLPASDWTTDALKREHAEDIYYNRTAGHAWRWMATADGSYAWHEITDQESLRALETAAKAQDTADSKRRNFVAQPTNDQAYDIGDTWSNATYGDLYDNDTLVCIKAKAAGEAFSITHWRAASTATTAYIQNLGDEIRQVVADNKASGDAATAAAKKAADDAAKAAANAATAASNAQSTADSAKSAAANAQSTADSAKSTATANATAIVQNKDAISALAGKFTFDASGNVTNVKQSGVLMSADAASIYTKQETTNALGQRVTTAEAKIETSVKKDANGNIESGVKVKAKNIDLEGYTTINGGFKVKDNGDVELNNAVVNGYVMEKPHRFANRIGKFYLNPDKGSVFIAKTLYGKTSDRAYYKLPSASACSGRFITVVPLAFEKITSGNTTTYHIEMEYSNRYVITADGFGVAYNVNEGGQSAAYIGGNNCSKMKLDPLRGIYRFFSDGTSWYELGGHYDNLQASSDELSGTFENPKD